MQIQTGFELVSAETSFELVCINAGLVNERTMAAGWNADIMKALIGVWSQENMQSQLDSIVTNRVIYEKVTKKLEEVGYVCTWQQCRTRIKY